MLQATQYRILDFRLLRSKSSRAFVEFAGIAGFELILLRFSTAPTSIGPSS